MKKVNWWIVGTVVILASILLFGGGMMSGWRSAGYGMMGGYGGHMSWGYSPFGWIGMLFMWLIPIGVFTLIGLGVISLVRSNGTPASQVSCSNCGKGTQADWQTCPYCGTSLK